MKRRLARPKETALICVVSLPVIFLLTVSTIPDLPGTAPEVIDIGSRLELFVDDFLVEKMEGARLLLHHPIARDVAIVFDRPWEGNTSGYVTVFQDGDIYRMYYRGSNYDAKAETYSPQVVCYAESRDGIHWQKPDLGLVELNGSKKNNILWTGLGTHNFTPLLDFRPGCPPDEKYKALASDEKNEKLFAFKSADGLHWSFLKKEPVIPDGHFDSQNLAFWDPVRGAYLEFNRGWRNDTRDIMTSRSADFRSWTEPQWLDWGPAPAEHLYTNTVIPYFRAPHLLIGFPKRFVPDRKIGTHKIAGVSDGLFMSSRDGLHWKRWGQAFLRPGLQKERWVNRNNMIAWGILATKPEIPGLPDELSFFSSEGYYVENCRMRRHTLRLDGFVSVNAESEKGELVTKPVIFQGDRLILNFSTSAAGSIRVEIQDEQGHPIPNFALADCEEIYGDEIGRAVGWKDGPALGAFAGRPVRLRFVMKDADLYAFCFK
jgi:hypothetical protein